MEHMLDLLGPETAAAKRIRSLWHEYEERQTPEARFVRPRSCSMLTAQVKDLDRFELGLQAVEYEGAL